MSANGRARRTIENAIADFRRRAQSFRNVATQVTEFGEKIGGEGPQVWLAEAEKLEHAANQLQKCIDI